MLRKENDGSRLLGIDIDSTGIWRETKDEMQEPKDDFLKIEKDRLSILKGDDSKRLYFL